MRERFLVFSEHQLQQVHGGEPALADGGVDGVRHHQQYEQEDVVEILGRGGSPSRSTESLFVPLPA